MYDNDIFEVNGRRFTFKTESDYDSGPPWENDCGTGIVSEWTRREKRPGERLLHSDHGSKRYYDFQATMQKAVTDGWSVTDPPKDMTKRQLAALAVENDYERLRRWCDDQWSYVGVVVTDEISGESASLWGIESDCDKYLDEVAHELANELFPLAEAHEAAAIEIATD